MKLTTTWSASRSLDRITRVVFWGCVVIGVINILGRVALGVAPTWVTVGVLCWDTLCAYWLIDYYRFRAKLRQAIRWADAQAKASDE